MGLVEARPDRSAGPTAWPRSDRKRSRKRSRRPAITASLPAVWLVAPYGPTKKTRPPASCAISTTSASAAATASSCAPTMCRSIPNGSASCGNATSVRGVLRKGESPGLRSGLVPIEAISIAIVPTEDGAAPEQLLDAGAAVLDSTTDADTSDDALRVTSRTCRRIPRGRCRSSASRGERTRRSL